MIKLEETDVYGFEAAIRGMRNPKNSWDKSDSLHCIDAESKCEDCGYNNENGIPCPSGNPLVIGKNDMKLMKALAGAGTDHGKFLRMINVTVDITAPLYWWKEFDTYKVGTVANSCSTMHKIAAKKFTLDDFSHEHLSIRQSVDIIKETVDVLNVFRNIYLNGGLLKYNTGEFATFKPKDKEIWWQMIQLLPSSYNQKRTVQLNYAVLLNMYQARKNHKLDEWHDFCKWVESLPYFTKICLE